MKPSFFLAALISVLYFSACNKDNDNPTGNTKQLTGYTGTQYADTVSYDYNSNGQIIGFENNYERYSLDITGSQVHFLDIRKEGSRTVADATFTLNGQGNIISGQGSFSYNIGGEYTSQFTFTYDSAGNLINSTDVRSDGNTRTYELAWTNGDITSRKWIQNGSLYFTQYYEYDTSLEDKNKVEWLKFLSPTNSFMGNSNKHLIKRYYAIFAPGSTVVQETTYAYNLDADGYPKTMTVTGITTPGTDVVTYHYQ
jgi:hypothetical protein